MSAKRDCQLILSEMSVVPSPPQETSGGNEIAHFRTMLEQSKRKLSDADISALVVSLEEANKK